MQRMLADASHVGRHIIAAHSSHWVQLDEPELVSAAVQQLVQFGRIVRYRKHVVLLALVAAGVLGGLYYVTATRYYEARASQLVLQLVDR